MDFLISTNIIVLIILITLILVVVFKMFVKKKKPTQISYTPFDYITGQSDEEFHEEEQVVTDKDDD